MRDAQVCRGNSISGLLTDSGAAVQTWHPAPGWLHLSGRPCLLKMLQPQNSAITWGPVVQAHEPEGASHTQMITALKKKKFFLHFLYFFPCNSCYIFRWNSSSSIQVNLDLRAELMWNFSTVGGKRRGWQSYAGVQCPRLMVTGQCSGWTHGVGFRGHRLSQRPRVIRGHLGHLLFFSPFLYFQTPIFLIFLSNSGSVL